MDFSTLIILGFYMLLIGVVITLLIYLVVRRIEKKSKEDFEKRDN